MPVIFTLFILLLLFYLYCFHFLDYLHYSYKPVLHLIILLYNLCTIPYDCNVCTSDYYVTIIFEVVMLILLYYWTFSVFNKFNVY